MEHKNYVEFTDDILEFFEDEKRKGDKVYLIFFCSGDCYPNCDILANAIEYHYNFSQEVISDIAEHYPKFYRGGWEFNKRFRKWRKMKEPGVWQSISHTCSIGEIEFTEKVKDILGLVSRVWFDDDVQDENFREAFKMLKQRIFTEWYFTKEENSSPIHLIIPRFGGGADRLTDETFRGIIFDEFKDLMDKDAVKISIIRREGVVI